MKWFSKGILEVCIGSKLVFNSNVERSMIEKLHPQNHTVVQEEDQHGIVTSIVTVIIK